MLPLKLVLLIVHRDNCIDDRNHTITCTDTDEDKDDDDDDDSVMHDE